METIKLEFRGLVLEYLAYLVEYNRFIGAYISSADKGFGFERKYSESVRILVDDNKESCL